MLKMDAEYGFAQSGPPMAMRNGSLTTAFGAIECSQPFEAAGIDVVLRAERPLVQGPLGALIDDARACRAKRRAVFFAFEKILPDLRDGSLRG